MMDGRFIEIEHKYLVDTGFDRQTFAKTLLALKPRRHEFFSPSDTYFTLANNKNYIYRYRLDRDLQELTVKSRGTDIEQRVEINVALSHEIGSQSEAVHLFLETFGGIKSNTLTKDIELFEFDDVEIAFYIATYAGREVRCVEFEALGATSVDAALATIQKYEELTGFAAIQRCKQSLFDLLIADTLN